MEIRLQAIHRGLLLRPLGSIIIAHATLLDRSSRTSLGLPTDRESFDKSTPIIPID
jgi:hypothetical protein